MHLLFWSENKYRTRRTLALDGLFSSKNKLAFQKGITLELKRLKFKSKTSYLLNFILGRSLLFTAVEMGHC